MSGPQPACSQGLEFQETNANGAGLDVSQEEKHQTKVASLKEFVALLETIVSKHSCKCSLTAAPLAKSYREECTVTFRREGLDGAEVCIWGQFSQRFLENRITCPLPQYLCSYCSRKNR